MLWGLGARAEVRGSPWVEGRGMSSRGPGELSGRQGSDQGTARGGSAVLQPGEPGRSWGSGRSSRRRASEGLVGRCAEGECSRLKGTG